MRIGLFTDSYLPRRSGVVRAVEAASRHLRSRGHHVSIIAPAYPGYTDADPDVYRFPSVAAPGHADFPLAVPYSGAHLRAIRGMRLDVVHTHSPFLLGGVGLWVGRTLRLPVAFTYHTLYSEYAHYAPFLGELTRPLVVAYTTAYCNRCDLVLASVASLAGLLRQYGVRAPIEVIPSVGIDEVEFAARPRGDTRGALGIPAQVPLLLCVSRLAREKGIALLIDALAVLPPAPWLLLVGDGPEREALRRHAERLGVAGRVVFAGGLAHPRVLDALDACDVFVFPSRTETLGLAVLEAMAAGRAVVAVRAGAVADIVRDGETGRLVSPTPAAMAAAVAGLLGDPTRRAEMGRLGRTASAAYAQERITDRLIAVYEGLVSARVVPASREG